MELGADAVLVNTGIAGADNSVLMAQAMKNGVLAGRQALPAGRMPRNSTPQLQPARKARGGNLPVEITEHDSRTAPTICFELNSSASQPVWPGFVTVFCGFTPGPQPWRFFPFGSIRKVLREAYPFSLSEPYSR